MSKGRTTGDNLDGGERNPKKWNDKPNSKPSKIAPEQEQKVYDAILNSAPEKKIKAMITRFVKKKSKRKR